MLELWYFTWVFYETRPFNVNQQICSCDLGVWPTFLKTLSMRITFEQWDLELWCFTWVPTIVTLTLEIDLLFENFNSVYNIWIVSAKALIFHISIFSMRTFQFYLMTLTLKSGLRLEYFDPVYKIWIVSARALIFLMYIACDKIFV